jgi:hypothetical protein
MLKFNRTPSAHTIIDECIFRVFHNENKRLWCDLGQKEEIVERCMNYGVFSKFQSKVLTVKFQNQVWNNLKKDNLDYSDAIPALRELFYDYQEGIKFSTKYFLAI